MAPTKDHFKAAALLLPQYPDLRIVAGSITASTEQILSWKVILTYGPASLDCARTLEVHCQTRNSYREGRPTPQLALAWKLAHLEDVGRVLADGVPDPRIRTRLQEIQSAWTLFQPERIGP